MTDLDVKKGDKVVVETVRGLEMGEIISDLTDLSEFKLDNELKRIKQHKKNRMPASSIQKSIRLSKIYRLL